MEKAIKKAIEGGWRPRAEKATDILNREGKLVGLEKTSMLGYAQMTNDPLFWQALGKAEGWTAIDTHRCSLNGIERTGKAKNCSLCFGEGKNGIHWLDVWHLFIDHLASGKSADEFFEELLK